MKIKSVFFVLAAIFLTALSCKQPGNESTMSGNSKEETYAMCREMMKDPAMMREMMDNMMKQCAEDSAICKMMCEKMMDSPHMRNMMMKSMEDGNKNSPE